MGNLWVLPKKGSITMKFRRFFSASAAALMAVSSLPAYSLTASAATRYSSDDYVVDYEDGELFEVQGRLNNKVLRVFERATGKDYELITFGDLEKITSLDLSGLELEGVPAAVQYMVRLRTLDLSENLLRSSSVSKLDLSRCIYLDSLDISNNYLTSVPSWYLGMDLSKKDISNNLIGTTGQRSVTLISTTYYFMVGDIFNEKAFKDRILSTIGVSDGTKLPDYFYDPDLPTYNIPKEYENDDTYDRNYNVFVDFDASKFVKDGVVTETGTIEGEAGLIVTNANENTSVKFKLHFLDGNDPTTVKIKLETLINECKALDKTLYTAGSWASFEATLKSAEAIKNYAHADGDMIQTALSTLTDAKNNLVEGVSADTKKILNDLLAIAKNFKEADYSEASWKKYERAVTALEEAANDAETSIAEANEAIKAFQTAQAGLTVTLSNVPDIIKKAEFEAIYGEDETVTARGTTRGGYRYAWVFNGNDVTLPADFNPEISYESQYEESIRFEVGSARDYHLIKFAESGKFPGTAVVTLDVSGVYDEGTYCLYKCTGNGKSEFLKEVEIMDGEVEFTVDEGGDYFISSVLQNFQMISTNFDINHEKLTISGKFKKKYTVGDFRTSVENGEAVNILEADGTEVFDSMSLATGMTAAAPNSDVSYIIVVPGDCDGDGNVTALDTVEILRAIVGENALTTYHSKSAADVNGDGWVRTDDAVEILKYVIGIE